MAILWQKKVAGTTYEVRSAGRTRRLYTDGVFHSQYNPERPVTGSIWDLLLLPAYFYPKGTIKRILVLGVGGGAVIQQFQHFLKPEKITGVELNTNHLYIARHYFGVRHSNITLIHADAIEWVKEYQGERFDLIVDDLFGEQGGEPVRAINANLQWFRLLSRMLSKEGALVTNFVSSRELKQCSYFKDKEMRGKFKSAFKLSAPAYENAIGVFLKVAGSTLVLKKHLIQIPELNPNLKSCRLNYSIQRL